jgi:hypothetical protein
MKQKSTLLIRRSFLKGKLGRMVSCCLVALAMLGTYSDTHAQCSTSSTPTNNCASFGMNITAFTLNNITATGNTGCSSGGYGLFTSPVWTLITGQTYSFSVTINPSYPCGFAIWIDLNNNNIYDSNEMLYSSSTWAYSFTGTITIPTGTPSGSNVAMRLRTRYSATISAGDVCTNNLGSYGETEDYKVNILGPCAGQPTAGTALNNSGTILCAGKPNLDLPPTAYAAGMQYQWQVRNIGQTNWTNSGSVLTLPPYTPSANITSSKQYRCWARCISSNLTDTSAPVTVTVNGTTITPPDSAALCTPPNDQPLTIFAPALPDTLFKENFEGSTTDWTFNNATFYNWGVVTSPYNWSWMGINGISSPGNNKFLFLNVNNYVYSTAYTEAITPSFSTIGYTTGTLTFRHYQYYYSNFSPQTVDISINGGTTWVNLAQYSGSIGSQSNFASVSITLAAGYLNQANVKLRFREIQYYPNAWAIDDIAIVGAHGQPSYAWTASPSTGAGLPTGAGTASGANTSIIANPSPGEYVYTATLANIPNGCPTTKSVLIKVGPKPSSTISGDATICNGGSTPLTVNLAGATPYQLIYSDGTTQTTINNITTSSVTIPVSPNTTKTYSIVGLATPICTATTAEMPGSALINVNQRPTSSMNNGSQVACDGFTTYIPVTFTGTPPLDITYTDGSTTFTVNGINTLNYQLPVMTITGTHTYTISSIADANGCIAQPSDMTGNFTITSQIRPTGAIAGSPTLCNGSLATLQVSFTGTPPYSFGYTDGGSFIYSVNNVTTNPYTLVIAPSSTVTYSLDHVTDANCSTLSQDLSGSSFVTVNNRPTSSIAGLGQTLCYGNQVNLSVAFTGIPPYSFGYSNGTSSNLVSGIYSSTYNFTVTPNQTGTYIVTGLNDLYCAAQLPDMTGAVPITIRHPEATISGTQVSCMGDNSSLLIDFSGAGATPPYTFVYNNGTSSTSVTTSSDPYVLNVMSTNSTNYSLVSMMDANCPGDVSGSAALTVNPSGGWKGMISSDWQNPSNWCGVLPTATTDVLIPSESPNMPVLSYGAAYCDTLTVMPGASVTVNPGTNMNIYGDIMNNGTLNWANGNINLNGSVPQYVSGFTAQNLYINNGPGVVPTSDIDVTALMVLNGNVYLNNSDLVIKPSAIIIGAAPNKYVHTQGTGTLRRTVNAGFVDFPVGNSTYNPVSLLNTGVPDNFAVRVVDAVYADGYGINPATVTFPVVNRTWMISEETPGNSIVRIKAQWNGYSNEEVNFFDRGHAFIRHWDGSTWSYQDSVNAGAAVGINPYTVTENGYTSFSPFTVGSSSLYPLAIDLLDFTAQLQDNDNALVSWNISQSSDAKGFDVEYSTDGTNFTKVGEVSAVANKTNYSMMHRGLAEGRNYYRLKAIDVAGNSAYSKIAVVTTKGLGVDIISLSPNPVTGIGTLAVSSDDATSAEVRVMDAVGRVLNTTTHSLAQGMNSLTLDMNSLPQGNYTLHVITNTGNATPVKFTKL